MLVAGEVEKCQVEEEYKRDVYMCREIIRYV